VLILLALGAVWTGERAYDQVPRELPGDVWGIVLQHEAMAEQVWVFAAVTAVLLALSALPIRWFRGTVMALAMVASLATAGWVATTGHYGGTLVYSHGVGTPGKALNRPLPAAPEIVPEPAAAGPQAPAPGSPAPPGAVPPTPLPPPEPIEPAPVLPSPETPVETVPGPSDATPVAPGPSPAPDVPVEPDRTGPPPDGFLPALRAIDPEEAAKVSYARDVQPILEDRCTSCHEGDEPDGGIRLTSVSDMMKPGEKSGPGVIPFKPDESSMVQYIRGIKQPQMPRKRVPLTEQQLHVIRMWIAAGAQDDSGAPPPPSPDSALPPGTSTEPRQETPPTPPSESPADGESLRAEYQGSGIVVSARQ
jgi:hypothetical protein